MRKIIFSILYCFTFPMFAAVITVSGGDVGEKKQEVKSPEQEKTSAMQVATLQAAKSVMIIDAAKRAMAYKEAFDSLRAEKTASKVNLELISGESITNIIDINLLGEGSLLSVRYNTMQGIKHLIVPIESVNSLKEI